MKSQQQISFLSGLIQRFFPETENKVKELLASSEVINWVSTRIFAKIDAEVQFYVDNAERLKYLIRLLRAWQQKEYTDIHPRHVFIGGFVLLYAASPIDIIPDFIPFLGKMDDQLLFKKFIVLLDDEIEKFKNWEETAFPE